MGLIDLAPPLTEVPDRATWLDVLEQWEREGVLERPGPGSDHPLILEMLRLGGVRGPLHDEIFWCGCCGAAAMLAVGLKPPRNPYHARNWEGWGRRLDPSGPGGDERRDGAVAVLWRGLPSSGAGHWTTWRRDLPNGLFAALGGNQHNRVCTTGEPLNHVLSFRWPDQGCLFAPGEAWPT